MCVSVADGNDDDGDIEKGMIKYVFSYHIISFGKKIWNFFFNSSSSFSLCRFLSIH